jgi:hypothetical protein
VKRALAAWQNRVGRAWVRYDGAARLDPLFMWMGHYYFYFLLASVPFTAADIVTGYSVGWIVVLNDVTMFAWITALICEFLRHQDGLCERCIREAPTLNPEPPLRRWHWALWCRHQRRLMIALSGGYLAWILYADAQRHPQPWQVALDVAALLLVVVIWFILLQHRRLEPWCPYCHWGRGGDHETAPAPPEEPAVR